MGVCVSGAPSIWTNSGPLFIMPDSYPSSPLVPVILNLVFAPFPVSGFIKFIVPLFIIHFPSVTVIFMPGFIFIVPLFCISCFTSITSAAIVPVAKIADESNIFVIFLILFSSLTKFWSWGEPAFRSHPQLFLEYREKLKKQLIFKKK